MLLLLLGTPLPSSPLIRSLFHPKLESVLLCCTYSLAAGNVVVERSAIVAYDSAYSCKSHELLCTNSRFWEKDTPLGDHQHPFAGGGRERRKKGRTGQMGPRRAVPTTYRVPEQQGRTTQSLGTCSSSSSSSQGLECICTANGYTFF